MQSRWIRAIVFSFNLVFFSMVALRGIFNAMPVEAATVPDLGVIQYPGRQVEPVQVITLKEVATNFNINFPQNLDDKKLVISEYLGANGYKPNEINSWLCIIQNESGFRESATPKTWVKHCQRPNGSYYAAELTNCKDGDKETGREQSVGLTQILATTWKIHECKGDRTNWLSNLECAVKVQRKSGWYQWSTYSKCK
jgi:hypothetical protein